MKFLEALEEVRSLSGRRISEPKFFNLREFWTIDSVDQSAKAILNPLLYIGEEMILLQYTLNRDEMIPLWNFY